LVLGNFVSFFSVKFNGANPPLNIKFFKGPRPPPPPPSRLRFLYCTNIVSTVVVSYCFPAPFSPRYLSQTKPKKHAIDYYVFPVLGCSLKIDMFD